MAWQWSHSTEAYANAEANLKALDKGKLEVIYAEWRARVGDTDEMDEAKYEKELAAAKELPDDVLADFIWERASEQALCTNGGHEAHMCPFACGCHTVSFSKEGEDDEE